MSREAGAFLTDAQPAGGLKGFAHWFKGSVAEPVAAVLFPPRCVGCGDFESHLCERCEAALEVIGADCCPRCGEPGPRPLVGSRCAHCMGLDLACAGARSAFVHAGPAKRMVVEFKSGGQPVLAPLMARLAATPFAELLTAAAGAAAPDEAGGAVPHSRPVLVTWVPTHASSQRERGYNQAELLARALARGTSPALPVAALARKPVKTKHQKALDREGRQANLRGAFTFDGKALEGLPTRPGALVLVDDVYTTGATTQEVAQVLGQGTGLPVYVFTFSRAVSARREGHD
jgi:predicted amidophosphoribosyltransferase